jgi:alginate O-acetyltransferase complex protein AlgJ
MIKTISVLAIVLAGFVSVALRGGDTIWQTIRGSELTDLMSGKLSAKVDRAVVDSIPKTERLNGAASALLYSGLHDAGPQVWAGCQDWLYSNEELQISRYDNKNVVVRARIYRLLIEAFALRNILLISVPIPDKAEQVENELCGITAEQSRRREKLWVSATNSIDAFQLDLRLNWPYPGYWQTDTHWDSQGAQFAAEKIAQMINAKLGPGSQQVKLTTGATRERVGDLVRLAGLAEAPRWLAPRYEQELTVKADITRSGGLLDDVATPSIFLAGSSYSMNSGFIEYLQVALSREVAQMSQAGGGFDGALLELLQKKPAELADAKVVIWEWPMRSLTAPITEAERNFLKQRAEN